METASGPFGEFQKQETNKENITKPNVCAQPKEGEGMF